MSGLANRLVRDATDAIVHTESTGGVDDTWERSGRAAVVAVLRELVHEFQAQNRARLAVPRSECKIDGPDLVATNMELARVGDVLAGLAEVIEKGEQT